MGGSFNAYIKEVKMIIDNIEVLSALDCRYYNLFFIMSILNLNISREIPPESGIFIRKIGESESSTFGRRRANPEIEPQDS
jgi:hypothetical protein